MSRIVCEMPTGYVNIPGDRMVYDEERKMIFCYNGSDFVAAFDVDVVVKIHISKKTDADKEG